MKIKVIDVTEKQVPIIQGGFIKGTMYKVTYVQSTWSWRKFRYVTETKHAHKLPIQLHFRDSNDGYWVSNMVDRILSQHCGKKLYEND